MKNYTKAILILIILFLTSIISTPEIKAAGADYEVILKAYKVNESYLEVPDDLGILWAEDFQAGNLDGSLLAPDATLKEGDVIAIGYAIKFKGAVSPYASGFQITYSFDESIFELIDLPVEDTVNENKDDGGLPSRYWNITGAASDGIFSVVAGDDATSVSRRAPFSSTNANGTPIAFNFLRVKTGVTPGKEIVFEKVNDPSIFSETIVSDYEANPYDLDMTIYNNQLKVYEEVALPSDDTTLSSLTVKNANKTIDYILTPTFVGSTPTEINKNQPLEYTVIVPSNITEVVINASQNEAKASLSLNGGETVVSLGLPGTTTSEIFTVTPEPGSTASVAVYRINIKRLDNNSALNSLSLSGITGLTFNKDTLEYNLTVPFKTTTTTVSATLPNNSTATIKSGTGAWDLSNYGSTVNEKTVRVEAEDCKYTTTEVPGNICSFTEYKINITRNAPDQDSSLSSLVVKDSLGGTTIYALDKTFDPGTKNYTVIVPFETTSVFIEATSNSALANTPTGIGNVMLTGNSTLANVVVTAEDGTSSTYKITINKEISTNANLTDIKIGGVSITSFSKDNVGPYTLDDVKGNVNSLAITYTKENTYSTVNITGDTLQDGNNTITLTVTAQDGTTTKTYTLNVYRKSNNANLQNLTVTSSPQGTLNPSSFNASTKTYIYTYDETVTSINISATKGETHQTITGDTSYDPKTQNSATINVTAEDGTKNSYTVNFTRKTSTDATLSRVEISYTDTDGNIQTVELTKSGNTYSGTVPYEAKNVTVNAIKTSDAATIITGNGSWTLSNVGSTVNTRIVTVQAESGATVNYTLNVTRTPSSNNYLKELKIDGTLINGFDKTITTYTLDDVKSTVNQLNLTFMPENSDAKAVIVTGTNNLNVGNNTVIIRVTAQDNTTRDYKINVKKLSGDAKLASLAVTSDNGNLTPTFNPNTTTYTYKYDRNVTNIHVSATANAGGTVSGTGDYNPNNTTSVTLTVTAEDTDITKTYTINFEQILESDNELSALTVTNTADSTNYPLTPGFTSANGGPYSVTVPSDVSNVTINATPKGQYTKGITGTGATELKSGSNTVIVEVTAEDNSKKTYTINITREINENATLEEIVVDGTPIPGFKPEDATYDLGSVEYAKTTIDLSATGVSGTTLTGTGIKNLEVGDNTFEIVVTADSGAKGTYTVKVRRKSNDSTIKSLTSSEGTVRNTGTKEYTIDVPSGITNLTLTPTLNHNDASIISPSNLSNIDITNLTELNIEVRAEDTDSRYNSTYKIVFNKLQSTNVYLSSLTVDQGILSPSFNKETNNYTVTVNSEIEEITITAVAEDNLSTVSGDTGLQNLNYGPNTFTVKVTAENGDDNDYVIIVTRTKKNINTLTEITIDGTPIPNFSPDQETYEITVPEGTSSIEIDAIKGDEDQTITGLGTHQITGDTETIIIKVEAQDGTEKTYTIVVKKADPSSVFLDTLSVDGFTITPTFDKDTLSYIVNDLTNETNNLVINATTSTPNAVISYELDTNGASGNHIIDISTVESGVVNVHVTADGITKTYKLSFTKSSGGLDKITSAKKEDGVTDIHRIDKGIEDENVFYIWTGRPNQPASEFKQEFINEFTELHIYNDDMTELSDTSFIGSGKIIRLERNGTVLDEKIIIVKGDVTGEGRVTIADALKISNKLRDADTMTGAQFEAADVTGEGRKSIADALKVSNFLREADVITW